MIDFENIVETLLKEMAAVGMPGSVATASGTQPTSTPAVPANSPVQDSQTEKATEAEPENLKEEEISNNLNAILIKHQGDILTNFKKTFPKYFEGLSATFPQGDSFKQIIYTVTKNSIRTTQDPEAFNSFGLPTIFPLLDLFSLAKATFVETKNSRLAPEAKKTAVEEIYKGFNQRMELALKSHKFSPIEYPAIDPWAISVRKAYFEKQGRVDIGKLKLESSLFKGKSIYDAIFTLLEQRRISRIKLINKTIQIGNATTYIDSILKHPNSYTEGQTPFPDKKIAAIYGDVTDLLLSVAKNAELLFEQQLKEKNPKNQKANEAVKAEFLWKFLHNDIDWTKINLESFDLIFNQFCSQMLNEMMANPASGMNYSADASEGASETALLEPTTFVTGKYAIGDIISNKQEVPEANNLYNSLKALGDYIQKDADQADWGKAADAVSKIAKGLSFGAPEVKF